MDTVCLVAAPDVRPVDATGGRWLLWGDPADDLRRAVVDARTVEDAVAGLVEVAEDAAAVRLGPDGSVDAFRSVTASHDLYLTAVDGTLVVADCFRNALAERPVERREPAPNAATDHLLFRHPPEPDTHVADIRALEHGTWLHREADGTRTVTVVDRLDARSAGGGSPVDALDAALDACLTGADGATNMLSGGVDSTLVGTYLDPDEGDPPSLSMAVDSPEFATETTYAGEARDRLGVDGETVRLREADFLAMLEDSVDALGYPAHYQQTVLTDAALRRTEGLTLVNAEGADALFGLTGTKSARIAAWLGPLLGAPGGERLWRAGPGRAAPVAGRLADVAGELRRDPADPRSFAQRLPFYTDPGVVGRLTNPAAVRSRLARSLEYVTERVRRRSARRGFAAQAELAHLLSSFRHDTVSQWRQLGYVHGHALLAPFKRRHLADVALDVPAERRYVPGPMNRRWFEAKHVPKRLLARRLPDYPVSREKGAGALPLERYLASGPLAGAFERYAPPAFVPESSYPALVESFGPVTWNLLTWAVWRDRVLKNPDLERVAGTAVVRP